MQVGLGTSKLQDNQAFQQASYGFTVFSIITLVIILFSWCGSTVLGALKRRTHSEIPSDRFERGVERTVYLGNWMNILSRILHSYREFLAHIVRAKFLQLKREHTKTSRFKDHLSEAPPISNRHSSLG